MNTELLLKVKEQILREPKQFVMRDVFLTCNASNIYEEKYSIPNCGTAACIAGWVVSIDRQIKPVEAKDIKDIRVEDAAHDALHTDYLTSKQLFYLDRWPSIFRFDWQRAQTAQEKSQVAANRIDHFIATEGKE